VNWGAFLRREWGAVSFVLTVLVGMVVVPLALYFGNQAPAPVVLPSPTPTLATGARVASPAHTASPTPPASATPSK